jgi:hypothetical protein
MNTLKSTKILVAIFMVAAIFAGCDTLEFEEPDKTYQGDVLVKFNTTELTLFAEEDEDLQTVGISALRPASESRTYSFTVVDSLTTAEEGVDYLLDSNTFTIEANEVLGEIPITLIKENLNDSPTLHLQITANEAASYNTSMDITLSPFFPFERDNFLGDWELVYPWFYGPDPVALTAIEGSSDNSIIVVGMIDGTDIEIFLDDSDKANFTSEIPVTAAAWQHPQGPVSVEASGSFYAEVGAERIQMSMAHFIPGVGNFGAATPFTLSRP